MTQMKVRVSQEAAGHLGSAPLPVSAVNMDIAEILDPEWGEGPG